MLLHAIGNFIIAIFTHPQSGHLSEETLFTICGKWCFIDFGFTSLPVKNQRFSRLAFSNCSCLFLLCISYCTISKPLLFTGYILK